MDNYGEARAGGGNRKLFNDKIGRKWEHDRYVEVEKVPRLETNCWSLLGQPYIIKFLQ